MKASELRIGNWYKSVKYGCPVVCNLSDLYELYHKADGAYNDPPIDEMFEPIPLTEEWLLKFGFEGRINETSQCGNFYLGYDAEYGRHRMSLWYQKGSWCFNHTNTFTVLKYVHQLQNLYYALTGEEL